MTLPIGSKLKCRILLAEDCVIAASVKNFLRRVDAAAGSGQDQQAAEAAPWSVCR
jgi:hypothetical protein